MPWNHDDEEINGIVDANLKDSPPNPPGVNTAASIRNMLKTFWSAIRGQVSSAVDYIDQDFALQVSEMLDTVETRVSAAEAKADSVYTNFDLAKFQGKWSPLSGPALPSVPPANGHWYEVSEPGESSITGSPEDYDSGDRLIGSDTDWFRIPQGSIPADESVTPKKTTFIRIDEAGNFLIEDSGQAVGLALTPNGVLKTYQIETGSLKIGGTEIVIAELATYAGMIANGIEALKLTLSGGSMILYSDDRSIIRAEDATGWVGFNVTPNSELQVESVRAQNLIIEGNAEIPGLTDYKYPKSKLREKTVWWCGTSIPAGGLYPAGASAQNGALQTINKAVGSSSVRAANTDGSFAGLSWETYTRALSHTIAEKQFIIDNWDTIKVSLTGSGKPDVLSNTDKANFLSWSYENALLPYLNGTFTMPDLFVFDHGYNDRPSVGGFTESEATFTSIPAVRNNRNYYIGAANFIFDLILQYNPHARIAIIGHYENTKNPVVAQAQQALANYWGFPFLKLWEKTGWSERTVPGSAALWSTLPYSTYAAGQNTSLDMTVTRIWNPDGLHPHTDTSLRAQTLLTDIVGEFLSKLF